MKLEYRDLSSSGAGRAGDLRPRRFGFLDVLAASLLLFVVSSYFVTPKQIDRPVEHVVYDPSRNSFASFRCLEERTTAHLFTQSRDVLELRASVRVVRLTDLYRYATPQPDAKCYAARGLVEAVPRSEYFFGWLRKILG